MKNMEWSVLLSLALAAAAVIGYLCYSMFLKSVVVSVPRGDNVAEIGDTKSSDTIATTQIAELLVAAGLNSTSALGHSGLCGPARAPIGPVDPDQPCTRRVSWPPRLGHLGSLGQPLHA